MAAPRVGVSDRPVSEVRHTWSNCLRPVPTISHAFIKKWAKAEMKVPQKTLKRGYAFFSGAYVHDVEVKDGCPVWIRAKCFPSMKKNEAPKQLKMSNSTSSDKQVDCDCSCTAGKGTCNHSVALLYQLSHFQNLGLHKVPPIASKTSAPQQWHIPPRTHGIKPAAISNITILKTDVPKCTQRIKKKRRTVTVTSKVGDVPAGSTLAHQQAISQPSDAVLTVTDAPERPNCPVPVLREYDITLSPDLSSEYQSLACSNEESVDYELTTRKQSECPDWIKLRCNRLTSSKFKDVCSRQKDFDALAQRLRRKTVQTSAMLRGLQTEPTAAEVYARHKDSTSIPQTVRDNPHVLSWLDLKVKVKAFPDPQMRLHQINIQLYCPDVPSELFQPVLLRDSQTDNPVMVALHHRHRLDVLPCSAHLPRDSQTDNPVVLHHRHRLDFLPCSVHLPRDSQTDNSVVLHHRHHLDVQPCSAYLQETPAYSRVAKYIPPPAVGQAPSGGAYRMSNRSRVKRPEDPTHPTHPSTSTHFDASTDSKYHHKIILQISMQSAVEQPQDLVYFIA
uniref:SWIM-type domain-containing protein n=1 Tax=Branchiostoma floridae TaxID=7739 RepID=C3XUU4_BRAFL|eukprot:XP_002612160.1 hypothetical protein BRAFLDRAFT_125368 [Branchiostoma floridae]